MDHVFTIVSIINLYQKIRINLSVAFIDYAKAFELTQFGEMVYGINCQITRF